MSSNQILLKFNKFSSELLYFSKITDFFKILQQFKWSMNMKIITVQWFTLVAIETQFHNAFSRLLWLDNHCKRMFYVYIILVFRTNH